MPPFAGWDRSVDVPLLLLLGYLLTLWVGGWTLEFAARAHFRKAQRHAHEGFDYDSIHDHYECPQGELLTLHAFDDRDKMAIYKAPAPTCNMCVLKTFCTSHDEGRHVYRSLAEFHETDVGLFHRSLSLLILAVASLFAFGGLIAWWGRPGEPVLLVALAISLFLVWRDLASITPVKTEAADWMAQNSR